MNAAAEQESHRRRPRLSPSDRESMLKMHDRHPELTIAEIARLHGSSRATLNRLLAERDRAGKSRKQPETAHRRTRLKYALSPSPLGDRRF